MFSITFIKSAATLESDMDYRRVAVAGPKFKSAIQPILIFSILYPTVASPRTMATATTKKDYASYETLCIEQTKPFVFHVQLNRPDKLNAFNNTMWHELFECFNSLNQDPDCRAIVLSANGRLFTAGLDLRDAMKWGQMMAEIDDVARKAHMLSGKIKDYQNSISSLENCLKPVIAAVHSACVGAGINLVSAADIRYCTADAWFTVKEVDIGMPADVGVLQRLPKIIGNQSLVRELAFTARKIASAEALQCGLVSRVFDTKEEMIREAVSLAETIASKSPLAVQATKKNIVYSMDHTNQEGLDQIVMIMIFNFFFYSILNMFSYLVRN